MVDANNDPSAAPGRLERPWRWILLVLCAAFFVLIFYRGLFDPDEGRYAEIPREMVASEKWMEMRLLDVRYYEKPPLAYWISAVPLKIFGIHDWAVRMPLLPAALVLAFAGLLIATRSWGRANGFAAALTAVTAFGLFFALSMPIPDSYLSVCFAVTCVLVFNAFQPDAPDSRRRMCLLAAAVFVFLGTMTKGIVALVLPAAILFLWLLWERRLRTLWTPTLFASALVFLALIIPVTWQLEKHNPGFTRYFFIDEHLSRFTGNRQEQAHPEPPWFFLKVLPLLLAPWTLFVVRTVRTMAAKHVLKTDATSRFLLVWTLVVIGFFSASTGKLMSYIMPALLPLGLLVGRWGVAEPLDGTRADRRLWRLGFLPLPVLGLALPVLWILGWLGFFPEKLAVPGPLSALPLLPAVIVALLVVFKRAPSLADAGKVVATFYLGMAFLLSPVAGKEMNAQLHRNSAILFKELAVQMGPDDQVVMMYRYKPSAAFYTRRIPTLYRVVNEMRYGMDSEPGRLTYTTNSVELNGLMAEKTGRWFAVVLEEDLDDLARDGFNTNAPVLISNCDMRIVDLSAGQR